MSRWRVLAGTVALAVACTVAAAPVAAAQSATDSGGQGLENLATCIVQNRRLVAEVLVDQSTSLGTTDSEAERVDLARSVTTVLGRLASTPPETGKPVSIDLKVVGFGSSISPLSAPLDNWVQLDPTQPKALTEVLGQVDAAIGEFADRNKDNDTDYVQALDAVRADIVARSDLVAQESELAPSQVCRAVFWFTDGALRFGKSSTPRPWSAGLASDGNNVDGTESKMIKSAEHKLCDPNGIADQLRNSQTYLVTAALEWSDPKTKKSTFTADQQKLLRSITDQSSSVGLWDDGSQSYGEADCGAEPGSPWGTYFNGKSFDQLLDRILPSFIGSPPPKQQRRECPANEVCAESFELDRAVAGASVLVHAPDPGTIWIASPSEDRKLPTSVRDQPWSGQLAGADVDVRPAGLGYFLVSIDLPAEASKGYGTWSVKYRPTTDSTLDVWTVPVLAVFLRPIDGADEWSRGEQGVAKFELVDAENRPVEDGLVELSDLRASVAHGADSAAPIASVEGTEISVRYTPGVSNLAPSARVSVTATATTSGGLSATVAAAQQFSISVPGYPVVASIHMPAVEVPRSSERGEDKSQAVLDAKGTAYLRATTKPDSEGRVCVGASDIKLAGEQLPPLEVEDPSNPDDDCVDVTSDQPGKIKLVLPLDSPAQSGIAKGVVTVTVSKEGSAKSEQFDVPFDAQVNIDPPDPFTDTGRLVWLMLLAFLVPAGAWVAISTYTARFTRPSLVRAFKQDVQVRPAEASFNAPPLDEAEWGYLENKDPRHTGYEGLSITAPVRVFGMQDAVVTRGDQLVHGSLGPAGRRWKKGGRIAHQLHGQWVFSTTSKGVQPGEPISGELFLFVVGDAVSRSSESGGLSDRAHGELSAAYASIAERLGPPPATTGDDDLLGAGSSGIFDDPTTGGSSAGKYDL